MPPEATALSPDAPNLVCDVFPGHLAAQTLQLLAQQCAHVNNAPSHALHLLQRGQAAGRWTSALPANHFSLAAISPAISASQAPV